MDEVNQPTERVQNQSSQQWQDLIKQILRRKWLLGIASVTVLILLIIPMLFRGAQTPVTVDQPTPSPASQLSPTNVSEFTTGQLQAIEAQHNTDAVVAQREIAIKTKYPWFSRLPLRGEKYFVYFDMNKKQFVALLYLTSRDNIKVMQKVMQAEIKQLLTDSVKVPELDSYQFDWKLMIEKLP